jgi:hypothetical protein
MAELTKVTGLAPVQTDPELAASSTTVVIEENLQEDDPEHPYNWSWGKRMYHTICVALYAFTVYVFARPSRTIRIMQVKARGLTMLL